MDFIQPKRERKNFSSLRCECWMLNTLRCRWTTPHVCLTLLLTFVSPVLASKCLPFFPAVLMRFCASEPREKREKRQSEHVLVSRASREFWRNHLEFSLHFQAVDFRLNVFMLNNIIRSVINTIIGKICAAIIIEKKNLRKETRAAIANCATISLLTNLRYWQH